jgi:hypothetical protein
MAPSGATTPSISLANGSENVSEMEVQVVKEVEPLKVVVQGHPLVLQTFDLHLNLLWKFSKTCCEITKRFGLKNCEVYKSFNINPMKAYERPMHR